MNGPNLFERLESYAHENFVTETLAYILETDDKLRKELLRMLLADRPEKLPAYTDCEISTQVSYDIVRNRSGIIDLEIVPNRSSADTIRVEIKTQSQEGEGQVEKYLELRGYVAYLTPLGFAAPKVRDGCVRYLGHFFWRDVHSIIKNAAENNDLYKQFLQFLEARHMGSLEDITAQELKAAGSAVGFITKSQALVDSVRKEIEGDWVHEFGANVGAKGVTDDIAQGGLHSWWYRPKKWEKKRFWLCIGIGFEGDRDETPKFFLSFGTRRKFGRTLDDNLKGDFTELRKRAWKKAPLSEPGWEYGKYFTVGKGSVDKIALKQAKNVRCAMKELQQLRIIKSIEKRL